MPVIQPSSPASPTATVEVPRSNVTGTFTSTVPWAGVSVTGGPSAETAPTATTVACHAARSESGVSSGRSCGANRSRTSLNCPRSTISMTAIATSAGVIRPSG